MIQVSIYNIETGIIMQWADYPDHFGSFREVRKLLRTEVVDVMPGHIDPSFLIKNRRKVKRPPEAPPAVRPAEVKAEAERRILSQFPIWKQMNMIRAGEDLSAIDAIRAASNRIESMAPIPRDFTDDGYWMDPLPEDFIDDGYRIGDDDNGQD